MRKWILEGREFAVAVVLCGALASPAASHAAAVAFTDLTLFQAATNSATTFGFDGITADDNFAFQPGGFTVGGVNFVDSAISFVIGANFFDPLYGVPFFSGQTPTNAPALTNEVIVTLGTARAAFAMDFGSYLQTDLPISIVLSTGETFDAVLPSSLHTPSFIGFTSTIPITSLTLTENASAAAVLGLDIVDFTLANANGQSVPEPASLVLIATALAATGFTARRKAIARVLRQSVH